MTSGEARAQTEEMLERLRRQICEVTEEEDFDVNHDLLNRDKQSCSTMELEAIRRERNRMHAKKTRLRKKILLQEMEHMVQRLEDDIQAIKSQKPLKSEQIRHVGGSGIGEGGGMKRGLSITNLLLTSALDQGVVYCHAGYEGMKLSSTKNCSETSSALSMSESPVSPTQLTELSTRHSPFAHAQSEVKIDMDVYGATIVASALGHDENPTERVVHVESEVPMESLKACPDSSTTEA